MVDVVRSGFGNYLCCCFGFGDGILIPALFFVLFGLLMKL